MYIVYPTLQEAQTRLQQLTLAGRRGGILTDDADYPKPIYQNPRTGQAAIEIWKEAGLYGDDMSILVWPLDYSRYFTVDELDNHSVENIDQEFILL